MSSQGLFSIGGISSGLDTNAIIDQLLQLERQPIKRIEFQRDQLDVTRRAWSQVTTKLSGLRAAVDHTLRTDRFTRLTTAESSNTAAVQATATGRAEPASHTFTVERLARADQHVSADAYLSSDAEFGARNITVTVDGTPWDLTAGIDATTPLADAVAAINAKGAPVTAQVVQTEPGAHRLVLTASETGTASAFTVADDGAGFTRVQAAEDALIKVGGVEVTRSTNTVDDLIDGVELHLAAETTSPVTITTGRDTDAAVKSVTDLVEALNGVISTVAGLTDYDPETNEAAPLQGQFAASSLVTSLRSALSNPVEGIDGADGLASSFGISLTRDGLFEIDEAVLRDRVSGDLDGVAKLFSRSAQTTDTSAIYASSTGDTAAGTYGVVITRAAEQAAVTQVDPYAAPTGATTLRISRANGDMAEVTLDAAHADAASAAAAIDTALSEAGLTALDAEVVDGSLRISEVRYGDGYAFTVEELDAPGGTVTAGTALGLAGEHVGVDVAGTIGGAAATGSGRLLRSAEGAATGLSLQVDGAPAAFDVTYTAGLSGALDAQLRSAEGTNGTVARAQTSLESRMRMYEDRIESFEHRVEQREITIRRQFVGLETALADLNDQGAWLSQQLSGLNAQLGRS